MKNSIVSDNTDNWIQEYYIYISKSQEEEWEFARRDSLIMPIFKHMLKS